MAYSALRKRRLALTPEAIEDFCWDHWTAPTISDYDAQMNAVSTKYVITSTKRDDLISGVVSHVMAHFDEEAFRERQRAIARRPRPGGRVSSVEKLLDLPEGMSIPQQASALGCSISTINRLRRAAKKRLADAAKRVVALAARIKSVGPCVPTQEPRRLTLAEMASYFPGATYVVGFHPSTA